MEIFFGSLGFQVFQSFRSFDVQNWSKIKQGFRMSKSFAKMFWKFPRNSSSKPLFEKDRNFRNQNRNARNFRNMTWSGRKLKSCLSRLLSMLGRFWIDRKSKITYNAFILALAICGLLMFNQRTEDITFSIFLSFGMVWRVVLDIFVSLFHKKCWYYFLDIRQGLLL